MFFMSKFQRTLGNIVALLALLGIIVPTTWLALDRDPPIVLLFGEAIPSIVLKGGEYRLRWIPKHTGRACPGTVSWVFVDSEGTTWTQPKAESELDYRVLVSAEKAVVGRIHIMPTGAKAADEKDNGVGTLHTSADFRCNFTQWDWWFFDIPIHVDYPDIKIQVIALPTVQPVPGPPGPVGPVGPSGPKGEPSTVK